MRSTSEFTTIVQLLTTLHETALLSPEEKIAVAGVAVAEFNGRVNDACYEAAATTMLARLQPTPEPEEAVSVQPKRTAGPKAKAKSA
jgi:hypothetical protein